jgi:hypothetical protein
LARGRGRNRLGGRVRRAGDGADAIVRATKLGTQPMTRNRCSIPRPLVVQCVRGVISQVR